MGRLRDIWNAAGHVSLAADIGTWVWRGVFFLCVTVFGLTLMETAWAVAMGLLVLTAVTAVLGFIFTGGRIMPTLRTDKVESASPLIGKPDNTKVDRAAQQMERSHLKIRFQNAVDLKGESEYERRVKHRGRQHHTEHRIGVYNHGPGIARNVDLQIVGVDRIDRPDLQRSGEFPFSLSRSGKINRPEDIDVDYEAFYIFAETYNENIATYFLKDVGYWFNKKIKLMPKEQYLYTFRLQAENANTLEFKITMTGRLYRFTHRRS